MVEPEKYPVDSSNPIDSGRGSDSHLKSSLHPTNPSPNSGSGTTPEDDALDRALVTRLQQGGPSDKAAWSRLIARHQQRIYLTCLRMVNDPEVASDLTQDTFVKIIQGISSFDQRAKLTTWMTRIAMNVCLSHRRRSRVRKHLSLPDETRSNPCADKNLGNFSSPDLPSPSLRGYQSNAAAIRNLGLTGSGGELSGPQSVQQGEELHRLHQALAELEPDQRALLILRDVQGMEYEQIAQVLDIPLGTLKSRLFRARLALRQMLESEGKNKTDTGKPST